MNKAWSSEKISMLALVLLITGAIDSIRNLPTTALFGSSLVFFFIFSALVFLIPVALVSAELSSTWAEEEGGIYSWVRHAFGEFWAFIAIWLQWINTMVWYPSMLSFIAGTFAWLIAPELAQNKYFIITVILTVFWALTWLGMHGLRASASFAGICAVIGMILPMGLIILLGIIWLVQGHPLAIDLHWSAMIPKLHDTHSWISLTAIMTSFLGMELACVHVRNVHNPQKNFPRAMYFSVLLILITMIFGSLAIAFVLPGKEIELVSGIMQTFDNFLRVYKIGFLLAPIIILLLIGSIGSMINWIISPAKGLLLAADNGFLPHWLYKRNENGIASRILILQAVLVTLLCGGFLLFPSVNAIYWLFTALSTELYILMYVLMFFAAIFLKQRFAHLHRPFAIPGGRPGYYAACAIGIMGCLITLVVGFFPPENTIEMGSVARFQSIFGAGIIIMLLPALLLCWRRKRLMHN